MYKKVYTSLSPADKFKYKSQFFFNFAGFYELIRYETLHIPF